MIILIILAIFIIGIALAVGIYVHNNLHYDEKPLKKAYTAGYVEKTVTLEDGSELNYAEGPDNGAALLLIHGQGMSWEDYSRVLPDLAASYHVYAVDCYGHGKSSHDATKYSCVVMGKNFVWFIENVMKEQCVVSGHSSGGILAAWIASNAPKDVLGLVLEDPPFFSVEPDEMQNTFVWLDSFQVNHDFLNQSEVKDSDVYYFQHSYFWGLWGGLQQAVAKSAVKYKAQHPGKSIKLWYIPCGWIHGTLYFNEFDPQFAETFYNGSWLSGVSQEEILKGINCPSIYIKAATLYGKDGVLYAANTDEDAKLVHSLVQGNEMITIKSGHDIHFEHSIEFLQIMKNFLTKIK